MIVTVEPITFAVIATLLVAVRVAFTPNFFPKIYVKTKGTEYIRDTDS